MSILTLVLAASLSASTGLAAISPCEAIARHVDQVGGAGNAPVFLASYEPGPAEKTLPPPLATSAFSYDNALAIIALSACGDLRRARRISDAFVWATAHDRTFKDGRVRNAYRAGPVKRVDAELPGWWDAQQNLWAEDPYQDGSQTGNVAWVALALLTVDQVGKTKVYRKTVETLGAWIADHTLDARAPSGFSGGVDGFDPSQSKLDWRSTEHNVDVHALGVWLQASGSYDLGRRLAEPSKVFLNAMFDDSAGMFRLGTKPDGTIQPSSRMALDALIWPLIGIPNAPSNWKRSLAFAKAHVAVADGFDFNGDRDGFWTEGTLQAAVVEGAIGDRSRQKALFVAANQIVAPSGYLYATRTGRITTGIAIGPASKGEDFYYYHRPHLGATAWAVLAAESFNPFIGQRGDNVFFAR